MPQGVFQVSVNPKNPRDIWFSLEREGPVPDDQQALKNSAEAALIVLRKCFPTGDARFGTYYEELLGLSQMGLVGDNANVPAATNALASLKQKVMEEEAFSFKDAYGRSLGKAATCLALPTLIAALALYFSPTLSAILQPSTTAQGESTNASLVASFLLLWTTSMGGAWLVYMAKKPLASFEEMPFAPQDRVSPFVRLIFTGLIALVFGLFLYMEVIVVKLGPVSSEKIASNPLVGLLFGIVAGFSEQGLVNLITRQVGKAIPSDPGSSKGS